MVMFLRGKRHAVLGVCHLVTIESQVNSIIR